MTLDRMRAEAERLEGKIEDYQERVKVLRRKIVETENSDIITMVRTLNVTPGELTALLEQLRAGCTPKSEPDESEETDNEM